ncbi:MAG: bile acid:sodium symporter [Gemmataceae bacterium]
MDAAAKLSVLVFVVTCMAGAGLGLGLRDLADAVRDRRLVAASLIANFMAAPSVAFAFAKWLPIDESHAIGLLLLGCAAGAPFLPKLVQVAKGDEAFGIGLMLLLMVGSVVFLPLALPALVPGASAEPWPILKPLLFTMLLPLSAGMIVRSRMPLRSLPLKQVMERVSNVAMLAAVVLLVVLNSGAILGTFGSGAVAAGLAFVAICLALGWLCGGPDPKRRSVLGLGTGQRNIAAALLIATDQFDDKPGVTAMLLVTTLAGAALLLIAARRFAKR